MTASEVRRIGVMHSAKRIQHVGATDRPIAAITLAVNSLCACRQLLKLVGVCPQRTAARAGALSRAQRQTWWISVSVEHAVTIWQGHRWLRKVLP
jgi:hypothetical protein